MAFKKPGPSSITRNPHAKPAPKGPTGGFKNAHSKGTASRGGVKGGMKGKLGKDNYGC